MLLSYNSCFTNKYTIKDIRQLAKKLNIRGHTSKPPRELCPLIRDKMNDIPENEKVNYIILQKDHPLRRVITSNKTLIKKAAEIVFFKINFMRIPPTHIEMYREEFNTIQILIQQTVDYILQHAINNNRAVNSEAKPKLNAPPTSWKPKVGPHKLSNNASLNNNIFSAGNIPKINKTVYLKPNLQNNKVSTVYNLNGIKEWLTKNKSSPMTRKSINSWNNVLKLSNQEYRKAKPASNIDTIIEDGSDAIEYLQKIKSTKIIKTLRYLHKILLSNINIRQKVFRIVPIHAANNNVAKQTILTCLTNVKILADYIKSLKTIKERKAALTRFDESKTVCAEHMCSYIYEFVEIDKTGFSFSYDSEASDITNLSNLATAIRKFLCTQYSKKQITKDKFLNRMKHIRTLMYTYIQPYWKNMSMADILKKIDDFLKEYGEFLVSCDGLTSNAVNNKKLFPKQFKFSTRNDIGVVGIVWQNY